MIVKRIIFGFVPFSCESADMFSKQSRRTEEASARSLPCAQHLLDLGQLGTSFYAFNPTRDYLSI